MGKSVIAIWELARAAIVVLAWAAAARLFAMEWQTPVLARMTDGWTNGVAVALKWTPEAPDPSIHLVMAALFVTLILWYLPCKIGTPVKRDFWLTSQFSLMLFVLLLGFLGLGLFEQAGLMLYAKVVIALMGIKLIYAAAVSTPRFAILATFWTAILLGTEYAYRHGILPEDIAAIGA